MGVVGGAGVQASDLPVTKTPIDHIAAQGHAQATQRPDVAAALAQMPGFYLLNVPDTADLGPGDGPEALTFTDPQAEAHGVLRAGVPGTFYLPCTGRTDAAVNVYTDHSSGYLEFTIDGGIGVPMAVSASPDDCCTEYWLIGPKGAAVTATVTDRRSSGDPAPYSGTVFLQPLGNDAIN